MNNLTRYPGIPPFSPEQKDVFFGRNNDSQRLYNLLLTEKMVLLQSKSGLGKSSLLNAGLLPLLQQNANSQIFQFRFGNYMEGTSTLPLQTMVSTITQNVKRHSFLDNIIPNENSLFYHFKTLQNKAEKEPSFFLIFDQFEELFTYPKEQIFPFKKQLAELLHGVIPKHFQIVFDRMKKKQTKLTHTNKYQCLRSPANIYIVFAIRADKLSDIEDITDYIPEIHRNRFKLQALNREQIVDAIVQPARSKQDFQSQSFDYDSNTVDKIVKYLTNNHEQAAETTQLQIICQNFEKLAEKQKSDFIVTDRHLPDFKDIILRYYYNTIEKLPNNQQKDATSFIENHLIIGGHRISLDKRTCLQYTTKEILDDLVKSHLFRVELNSTGGTSYELAHDSMVPAISVAKKVREEKEAVIKQEHIKKEELQKAKLEAEENQKKLKKRQRQKFGFIIMFFVILFIISAIIGFYQQREKQIFIENQYNKYVKEANNFKINAVYDKAIIKYLEADSLKDEVAIKENIEICKAKLKLKPKFNVLLTEADTLFYSQKYIEAYKLYNKALKLNYNNNIIKEKIKLTKVVGSNYYFQIAKQYYFITDQKQSSFEKIKIAIELDKDNKKLNEFARIYFPDLVSN